MPRAALHVVFGGFCLLLVSFLPAGWSTANAAKVPTIVLPGILGSTLVDQSNRFKLVYGRFRGTVEDFEKLKLPVDLNKNRLVPSGLVMKYSVPRGGSHDMYIALVRRFEALGYEVDRDLFLFPYDWRLSNFRTAERLHEFIRDKGLAGKPIDLVGHSMGGLVALIYIHTYPQQPVRNYITMGTPFLGSVETIRVLAEGAEAFGFKNSTVFPIGNTSLVFRVVGSMESVYELMPYYKDCCYRIPPGGAQLEAVDLTNPRVWEDFNLYLEKRIGGAGLEQRVADSFARHNDLRALVNRPLPPGVRAVAVVSRASNDTLLRAGVNARGPGKHIWEVQANAGDGTVALASALGTLPKNADIIISPREHRTLFDDDGVWAKLGPILQASAPAATVASPAAPVSAAPQAPSRAVAPAPQPAAPVGAAAPQAQSGQVAPVPQPTAGYDSEARRAVASLLAPEQLQSAVHRVRDSVPIYAGTYHFTIDTEWGPLTAYSYDMLQIRLREIFATEKMDQVSRSEVYAKALGKAATAPIRTAGNLITDPVDTITGVPRGMFSFLGRIGDSMSGDGEHDDNVLEAVTASSAKKREIAFKYGVSPYSSNKVMQKQINGIARAAALGGLTMTAATFAMPGGIGMVFTAGKLSQNMAALLRDKTPAELREMNRKTLERLGVPKDDAERFLANGAYNPGIQTYLVQSLGELQGASQVDTFVRLATTAEVEDDAFLYQRIAQMMAGYSQNVSRITSLGVVDGLPVAANRQHVIVLCWPADQLLWLPRGERIVTAVDRIVDGLQPSGKQLWISGSVSPLARQNLTARGWAVHEGARGRLYNVM
jgi:pimeloyl-ACP methyl ester carboxylesterase